MNSSRRVLDKLWERMKSTEDQEFRAILVYSTADDEKGFKVLFHNISEKRRVKDFNGLELIQTTLGDIHLGDENTSDSQD